MTNDRRIEGLLDAWFADGPMTAPDRVLDDVAARIGHQAQHPAWRLQPWRFPTMSTPFKLVLIGAALLAALVIGGLVAGAGGRLASADASPTPAPSPIPLKAGPIEPGTYVIHPYDGNPLTWTVTVPAGWSAYEDWAIIGPELPGNKGTALLLGAKVGVPVDSCKVTGTPAAATVDDLIAAFQARDDWEVSTPVDITVGGYTGRRIDIELPADIEACGTNDDYFVTAEDGKPGWYAQAASNHFTFWVLDVQGAPWVLIRSTFADVPAREITETDAMVESSVITP